MCIAKSPCEQSEFWCPESTEGSEECILQILLCDNKTHCSRDSDERDCASEILYYCLSVCLVYLSVCLPACLFTPGFKFTNDSYAVMESEGYVSVCVTAEFPASPLFSTNATIPLVLSTSNMSASESHSRCDRMHVVTPKQPELFTIRTDPYANKLITDCMGICRLILIYLLPYLTVLMELCQNDSSLQHFTYACTPLRPCTQLCETSMFYR